MPTFLSDPPTSLYLGLVLVAVVALVVWYRSQSRGSVVRLLVAAVLLGGLFLVDSLVESPREEAVRRVNEMIAAINARTLDRVMPHVADGFDYHGANKASFRTSHAWALLRDHNVRIAAWDFSRDYVEQPDPNTIVIGFMAKGEAADGQIPVFVRTTFRRDPDGAFRLLTFVATNEVLKKSKGAEYRPPGLP